MNVMILRTPMGDVIGDMTKGDGCFIVSKAFALHMAETREGVSIDFAALAPFADGVDPKKPYMEVEIPSFNVMFTYKPASSLVDGYMDAINDNRIITPKNGKIIT